MGYYFLAICQNCLNDGTLKFFLTQDHMELEISKSYFFNSFLRTLFKRSMRNEDTAYHRGMRASILLGNRPSLTKLMAL